LAVFFFAADFAFDFLAFFGDAFFAAFLTALGTRLATAILARLATALTAVLASSPRGVRHNIRHLIDSWLVVWLSRAVGRFLGIRVALLTLDKWRVF
jgi:hypothetical protein